MPSAFSPFRAWGAKLIDWRDTRPVPVGRIQLGSKNPSGQLCGRVVLLLFFFWSAKVMQMGSSKERLGAVEAAQKVELLVELRI